MPVFNVTAPTGETYRVNAPEGATEAQAIAYAQAHHASAAAPQGAGSVAGAMATLNRAIPGSSELGAGLSAGLDTVGDLAAGRKFDPASRYAQRREQQQANVDQLKAAHPVVSDLATGAGYAAQAAPALLSGGATAAPAAAAETQSGIRSALARLGTRTAAAAPKNATVGAAYAAVNAASQPGTPGERLKAANAAVIPGAAAGVIIPGAIDAASGVARHTIGPAVNRTLEPLAARIARATQGVTDEAAPAAASSFTAPELRAAQAIQAAIARDEAAGHVIDPTKPLRHAGGENVAALYDVVAKSPGPGRQIMKAAIDEHAVATSAAIRQDIGESLGGQGDYFAAQDKLSTDRQAAAKPMLDAAFSQPIAPADFTKHFGPIMDRLPKGAMAAARDLARMDGRNPEALGLGAVDPPGGHVVPELPGQMGSVSTPTLETMHYIKKGIDQTLEPYRNDVTRQLDLSGAPDAQAQSRVRTELGQAMRRANPDYDKAMGSWGEDSDNINALALGRNVFSPKFDMQSESLGRLHANMSDEAKAQFQKGVGEAIIAKVRESGDISAVRKLLGDKADEFRSRVALAFHNDPLAFGEFVQRMGGRADDAARDARFKGGSPTYGLQAARADLEAEGTHPLDVAADVATLNGKALAGRALKGAIKMLPRGASRSAITDPKANAALGRSATDNAEVARLLAALKASRRISAAPKAQARLAAPLGRVAASEAGRN
jgi:hypothetical protein